MSERVVADNLALLYKKAALKFGNLPAFATRKEELQWKPLSFRELFDNGLNLATALIDLGVEAKEHVGLFGDNRVEWIISDCGVQLCGAADVPRGRDVTESELAYIINHAEIKVAFLETTKLLEKVNNVRDRMPALETLILLDPDAEPAEGVLHLKDLIRKGSQLRQNGNKRAEERIKRIRPEDLFTLIYTSGTTGKPKGVMLTHANMMSQMQAIPIQLTCTDRVLSILPIWHIYERVFEVFTISCGVCTYYTSIRTLAEDLKNVEPTFMGSAPRLWENLYQRILKKVRASHPMRQILFHTAYFLSRQYKSSLYFLYDNFLKLKPASFWKWVLLSPLHLLRWILVMPFYGFFNVAVLEPVRLSAGGSLKATISGGGALPAEIDRFFNYIGITVLEGYGMTETSPVISVREQDQPVIGTVGPPVCSTEVRIVDIETGHKLFPDNSNPYSGLGLRGEIWIKGPQVMKGYYKEPELTDGTIEDGWMKTGDLGMMTFNNCLKILGRSKSTIVLLSGENLEPAPIEMRLTQSRYIEQCMVVGQDKKYISALIVPVPEEFRRDGYETESFSKLAGKEDVKAVIHQEIKKLISVSNGFKPHELIRDFRILAEPFKKGDELTSLFKIKRHVVQDKYSEVINEMYNHEKRGGN